MVGILVHGDNHFIVAGPKPDRAVALELAKHWSLIQIGAKTPQHLQPWSIRTKEFRENLEWAIVLPGEGEMNPAVRQLLEEISVQRSAISDQL